MILFERRCVCMTFSAVLFFDILILILAALTRVFSILYIVFSCKHYNEDLSVGSCILAVFFPLIAVIIQLSRKKHFQGEGMKICRQCGEKLPPSFEVCPRCLASLDPYDEKKSNSSKTLSTVMLGVFSVSKAVLVISVVLLVGICTKSILDTTNDMVRQYQRVSVTVDGKQMYFDKKGNSYENEEDVVLYAKDGTKYIYDADTYCYVSDKNEEFEIDYCYVDSDGWFYYDEDGSLICKTPDVADDVNEDFYSMKDKSIEEYLSGILSLDDFRTYYDEKGNRYCAAAVASWNEKGELITTDEAEQSTEN